MFFINDSIRWNRYWSRSRDQHTLHSHNQIGCSNPGKSRSTGLNGCGMKTKIISLVPGMMPYRIPTRPTLYDISTFQSISMFQTVIHKSKLCSCRGQRTNVYMCRNKIWTPPTLVCFHNLLYTTRKP